MSEALPTRRSPIAVRPGFWLVLLFLPLAYLAILFAFPVAQWLTRAFLDPTLTTKHVQHLLAQPIYIRILGNTFKYSFAITVICIVLAYPTAFYLSRLPAGARNLAVVLVLLPFWTSQLVRTFAWVMLLSDVGPIDRLIVVLRISPNPVELSGNTLGAMIGMVYVMLPYAILVIFGGMRTIDRRLLSAGATLGGQPWQTFLHIFLPLSIPGVTGAAFIVFINSLGFFVTPALLGGPRDAFISQSIAQQIGATLNWGFAALMALMLLASTLAAYLLYAGLVGLDSLWGTIMGAGTSGVASPIHPQQWLSHHIAWIGERSEHPRLAVAAAISSVLAQSPSVYKAVPWIMASVSWSVLLYLFLPILAVIPMSLGAGTFIELPPTALSLRWYEAYFTSPAWLEATWNSIEVGLLAALLSTVLGLLGALALVRGSFRFKGAAIAALLTPMIAPRMVIAVAVFYFFARLHILHAAIPLALVHAALGIPFVVISVVSVLQAFDQRLEQAALTLGAKPLQSFWLILFPLIRAGVLAGALFAFITSFDDVIVALFLTGGTFNTLPKAMWNDIYLNVDPTLTAVSVVLVAITAITLMATAFLRPRSGTPESS